jgi:hypothetical protein
MLGVHLFCWSCGFSVVYSTVFAAAQKSCIQFNLKNAFNLCATAKLRTAPANSVDVRVHSRCFTFGFFSVLLRRRDLELELEPGGEEEVSAPLQLRPRGCLLVLHQLYK